jgi:lipopolysaccharide export system protein LptA
VAQPFFRVAILLGILALSGVARSAPDAETGKQDEAVSVQSDQMVIHEKEGRIDFEGHVSLQKGGWELRADRAKLFLDRSGRTGQKPQAESQIFGPTANQDLSKIELSGDVSIQQGNRHAKAKQGVYDRKLGALTLSGEPEAWEAGYRVKGTKMTFFLLENRSVIEGGHVVIDPPKGK